MKKYKVDIYDPVVFPRKLWVTGEVEGLDEVFTFMKMEDTTEESNVAYEDILKEYETGSGVLVTCPVIKISTGEYGVLVIVLKPYMLQSGDEAHEAVHVADYIFEATGTVAQSFSDHNEPYAYLVGWAAGCISKTLIKLKKEYDN